MIASNKTELTEETMQLLAEHDFDALLTMAQIEEFEANYDETWRPLRRIALIVLARSKTQLVEGFGDGEGLDVLLDMMEHIGDYQDHLKSSLEVTEMAFDRLLSVMHACTHRGLTPPAVTSTATKGGAA